MGGVGHHPHKSQTTQLHDLIISKPLMLVAFDDTGQTVLSGKFACSIPDHLMFFGQPEIHSHFFFYLKVNPESEKTNNR